MRYTKYKTIRKSIVWDSSVKKLSKFQAFYLACFLQKFKRDIERFKDSKKLKKSRILSCVLNKIVKESSD